MKVALVVDDYLPHSSRVGAKMMHDLALELIHQGHKPIVITPHFEKKTPSLIQDNIQGVEVWRFNSGKLKDVGKVRRAINESLLSFKAWHSIKRHLKENTFDGIIYYSPSIFFGSLVSKIKKVCNCSSYLVLRDFFPQWAIDSGHIKPGSTIEKYFRYFEELSYDNADMIGVMSKGNLDIFIKNNKKKFPVTILRNWANLEPHKIKYNAIDLRKHLGLNKELIFFYGGNIGHAQDMHSLVYLAKKMQIHKNAHFLFLGQGDEVELIKNLAKKWKLKNFSYLPSVKQDKFKDILAQVDVGLFSLSSKHTSHNFPGKLLGYMAQSLPIIGCVNNGNDLIHLLNNKGAGFVSINGDDDTLLLNAEKLLKDNRLRAQIGKSANQLLKDEFSVSEITSSIIKSLLNTSNLEN